MAPLCRRSIRSFRRSAAFGFCFFMMVLAVVGRPEAFEERRPDYRPAAYALVGAEVHPLPDKSVTDATVIIRNGLITAFGASDEVTVPVDAEVVDASGLHLYPGFLDLFSTEGQAEGTKRSDTGLGRDITFREFSTAQTPPDNRNGLTPEFQMATAVEITDAIASGRRGLGFTDLLVAPNGAIATGQSALVSLSAANRRESVVASPIALQINLARPRGRTYGAADLLDARAGLLHFHHGHIHHHADHDPVLGWDSHWVNGCCEAMADDPPRPDSGNYPSSALMGVIAHLRQAMLDAEHHHRLQERFEAGVGPRPPFDPALETLHQARVRKLPVWWRADDREEIHRVLDLAEEFGTTAVIVGGAEAYKVVDRLQAADASVILTLDFDAEAPEVPDLEEYRKQELKDRDEPYRLLQKRKESWEERVANAAVLAEAGVPFALTCDDAGAFPQRLKALIEAGLSVESAQRALTRDAALIAGASDQLGTIAVGKLDHISLWDKPLGEDDAKLAYVFIDGRKFEYDVPKLDGEESEETTEEDRDPNASKDETAAEDSVDPEESAAGDEDESAGEEDESATDEESEDDVADEPFVDVATEFDEDRQPTLQTGGDVLITSAVVLTVTQGTFEDASILVRDGKIVAVGEDVETPEEITVIDAKGMFVMPGIIDTHSHMAISGGVNEGSLSIVPEVRVIDVVTGDDATIYRASAGGVTAARLLHGSANTIGGQDAVIKMHYGKPARELIVRDRPVGVKFALGENVTRKRSDDPDRFPYSRMGVEATLDRAFQEARAYQARWTAYGQAQARGEEVAPPRRDLRLEAVARIVDGSYEIHSHCYRADEILMLMRIAERYGVRVKSLQHVLEGYKIAPEIAAHGSSCSTFSDWWAYKVEAYDATPYNAALLTEAGAAVCIKSDSGELVRHLYLEAAKMVRYGGVSEDEALAMITINPAREIGLSDRTGSIEPGKDADLAFFHAHPLDGFAQCQLTLVEGEVAFQRFDEGELLRPRVETPSPTMPIAPSEARQRVVTAEVTPRGLYALTGATIHPVTKEVIDNGTLIVDAGRISAMGGPNTPIPDGAVSLDLGGLDVWPGMIDAGNTVGLIEIGSISATQDARELAPFQPELRTSVAIHPDSAIIPTTRANGVLSVYVNAAGGFRNIVSGQGCLADMFGWTYPEIVSRDALALDITMPPSRERIERLRSFGVSIGNLLSVDDIKAKFRQTLAYAEIMEAAPGTLVNPPMPDPRLAALVPYAKGEKPVILHADSRDQILEAIELAEDLGLNAILSGATDAWKIADAVKESGLPVILGGTLRVPSTPDPYDSAYRAPTLLHEAGILFALRTSGDNDATESRNVPFHADTAVAYGLPEQAALEAVTINPAKILGVEETHGSLEVGKQANLVITAGHILQPTSQVKLVFIGGRPIEPESKHTRLYERYLGRLAEVRNGIAPLGLERSAAVQAVQADTSEDVEDESAPGGLEEE